MKVEVDQQYLADLEQDKTSFGLCVSAIVHKHGVLNESSGKYEYKITLEDLQAISEAEMFIENKLVDNEPFTLVTVKPKGVNGSG